MEYHGKLFEEEKYMTTFRIEYVRKCSICGKWVVTEYIPNYPMRVDSCFRPPKEIFICQECEERYRRGEVDGEINTGN